MDPEARRVQVFRFGDHPEATEATHGERDTFETPRLPGLPVDTAKVFQR